MKQMKQSGAFDCPIYLDNISCKRSNLGSRFHLAKKKAAGIVLRTPFAGATQVFHHLEPGKPYGAMASSPCPARLFTLIAASRRRGAYTSGTRAAMPSSWREPEDKPDPPIGLPAPTYGDF